MGGILSSPKQDKNGDAVKGKQWQHKPRPHEYDEIKVGPDCEGQVTVERKYERKPRPYDEIEIIEPGENTVSTEKNQLNYIQVQVSPSDTKPRSPEEKTVYTQIQTQQTTNSTAH